MPSFQQQKDLAITLCEELQKDSTTVTEIKVNRSRPQGFFDGYTHQYHSSRITSEIITIEISLIINNVQN